MELNNNGGYGEIANAKFIAEAAQTLAFVNLNSNNTDISLYNVRANKGLTSAHFGAVHALIVDSRLKMV
jgi:hypothetical protein